MNPQTVPLPGALPLQAGALAKFVSATAPLLQTLSEASHPAVASQPPALSQAAVARSQSLSALPSKTSVN
jgi:hypothetical protein